MPGSATEAETTAETTSETTADTAEEENADTGVEGIAAVVGAVALAGAAVVVSRKRN